MEFLDQAEPRDREFVEQARQRLVELKKRVLGRLEIISRPAGADVYVDDGAAARGQTPLTVELAAGAHRVKVVAAGTEPVERSVEVVAGRNRRERFALIATAKPEEVPGKNDRPDRGVGTLVVHANVAGATVSVDGMVVGTTSLARASDDSRPVLHHRTGWGQHTVIVERPGGQAWRKQLHLSPNETVTVDVGFRQKNPRRRRLLTWGLAGLGTISLAAGATLGVLALRDVTQPTPADHSRGKSRALMSDFLLVGGAAAILGAWWLDRKPATSVEIQRTHTGE